MWECVSLVAPCRQGETTVCVCIFKCVIAFIRGFMKVCWRLVFLWRRYRCGCMEGLFVRVDTCIDNYVCISVVCLFYSSLILFPFVPAIGLFLSLLSFPLLPSARTRALSISLRPRPHSHFHHLHPLNPHTRTAKNRFNTIPAHLNGNTSLLPRRSFSVVSSL